MLFFCKPCAVTYIIALCLNWMKNARRKENTLVEFHLTTWTISGFSDQHSSLGENFLNLAASYNSPQYNIVLYNFFLQFVELGKMKRPLMLFVNHPFFNLYCCVEEEFVKYGRLVFFSLPLDGVWLDEPEWCYQKEKLAHQQQIIEERYS